MLMSPAGTLISLALSYLASRAAGTTALALRTKAAGAVSRVVVQKMSQAICETKRAVCYVLIVCSDDLLSTRALHLSCRAVATSSLSNRTTVYAGASEALWPLLPFSSSLANDQNRPGSQTPCGKHFEWLTVSLPKLCRASRKEQLSFANFRVEEYRMYDVSNFQA